MRWWVGKTSLLLYLGVGLFTLIVVFTLYLWLYIFFDGASFVAAHASYSTVLKARALLANHRLVLRESSLIKGAHFSSSRQPFDRALVTKRDACFAPPHPFISAYQTLAESPSASASTDSPFLFPRPSGDLFVSAWPNHGAGVGHQFGEWIHGPFVVFQSHLSYAAVDFLGHSSRWTRFLGFGHGEDTETSLRNTFDYVRVLHVTEQHYNAILTSSHYGNLFVWINEQRLQHMLAKNFLSSTSTNVTHDLSNLEQRLTSITDKIGLVPSLWAACHSSNCSSPAFSIAPGPSMSSALQIRVATMIRLYRIHVPAPATQYFCHPELTLLLRRKYCAARMRFPVIEDLYQPDEKLSPSAIASLLVTHSSSLPAISLDPIMVAVHLRCGDSCFSSSRATPLPSIANTMKLVDALAREQGFGVPFFHVFTQPPHNDTAENHFRALWMMLNESTSLPSPHVDVFSSSSALGSLSSLVKRTRWHFYTHAHPTLHHLARSDILMGSASSFSVLGALLHNSVTVAPIEACGGQVLKYQRLSGKFDNSSFVHLYNATRNRRPSFESLQDCLTNR